MADEFDGGEVVSVQASTFGELERSIELGRIPELIGDEEAEVRLTGIVVDEDTAAVRRDLAGLYETAEMLQVSRSRISALRHRPDFPAPVAELAAGPVWVAREIEAFADRWERQSGRPKLYGGPSYTRHLEAEA
jgi:hypothetical protein